MAFMTRLIPSLSARITDTGDLAIERDLEKVPVRTVSIPEGARLVVHSDPHGPGADRFRHLRLRLRELRRLRKLQSIAITSAQPQDGKSTVAVNLATALAAGGKSKVLCVEADLYHPTLCESLGLTTDFGLAETIERQGDPLKALLRLEPLGWYVLPAGRCQSNPADILHSDYLAKILDRLREHFEWIVFDSPPVLAVSDTMIISAHLDGALLVVRAGVTPRNSIDEALIQLGETSVIGIVLNDAADLNTSYSKYYGTYYQRQR
jgi:capsular exopolysaccharide synthesis family protein